MFVKNLQFRLNWFKITENKQTRVKQFEPRSKFFTLFETKCVKLF